MSNNSLSENAGVAILAMSSITYASKARSLLRSNGFKCEVVRTPNDLAKGCGYSVKVYGETQKAMNLLSASGITVKAVKEL